MIERFYVRIPPPAPCFFKGSYPRYIALRIINKNTLYNYTQFLLIHSIYFKKIQLYFITNSILLRYKYNYLFIKIQIQLFIY